MLSGIFQKRKKIQELRSPSLHDLKKFRDTYARHAERRHIETPSCLEKSIYKAISCQKELHTADFRQEDITDPQLIALAETLVEMPMISSLDLRDNRITDDGAKAILEVLRLQVIAAKTPLKIDLNTRTSKTSSLPEYTKYVTHVNLKGNEVSTAVQQELTQYTDILRREDKRLEIRMALSQIDRNTAGGIDEEEFKGVLKLLTGVEPSKKEVKMLMDNAQTTMSLENALLARCSPSPSKKAACPPWQALVQECHATLGPPPPSTQLSLQAPELTNTDTPPSTSLRAQITTSALERHQISANNATPPRRTREHPSIEKQASAPGLLTLGNRNSNPSIMQSVSTTSLIDSSPPNVATQITQTSPTNRSEAPASPKPEYRPPSSPPPPSLSSFAPSRQPSSSNIGSSPTTSVSTDISRGAESSIQSTSAIVDRSQRPISSPDRGVAANNAPHTSTTSTSQRLESTTIESPRSTLMAGISAFLSFCQLDDDDKSNQIKKTPASVTSTSIQDSPWLRDEEAPFGNEEEDSNPSTSGGDRDEDESLPPDEDTPVIERLTDKTKVSHETSRSVTAIAPVGENAKRSTAATVTKRMDADTIASEIVELSDGESDTIAPSHRSERAGKQESSNSLQREDLSSLIYHASEGDYEGETCPPSVCSSSSSASTTSSFKAGFDRTHPHIVGGENDHPEQEDEDEERVDLVLYDVMKNAKPRAVAKVIHSEFKRGLLLTDFPNEIPFRTLIALLLSENGLVDLALFKECHFPCALVLDLSKNKLSKLDDEALAIFPKLQVLNLAHNQLKTMAGVTKNFDLRALNLSHNNIKSVKNIEHLAKLQFLNLANNSITNIHALRLLSLHKFLEHLDLAGNLLMETDERQRRKNIVHVMNLLPTLLSLGSTPVASLHSKEKKKALQLASMKQQRGKSLFDDEMLPEFQSLWVTKACEILQQFQDVPAISTSRSNYSRDEDMWESNDGEQGSDRVKKPFNREQQRQKDELRSRAVGFRSRNKAIRSPPKTKTSAYCFGPPLPPPPAVKKKKAAAPVDPSIVQQQQRRASELSAPRHPPVDQALLKQEQKRKSRPAFDINMSVAERLQLAQEKALRRTSAAMNGTLARTGSTAGIKKRTSTNVIANNHAEERSPDANHKTSTSDHDVVTFRIEAPPMETTELKDVVTFRIEQQPQSPMSNSPVKNMLTPGKPSSPPRSVITRVPPGETKASTSTSTKESNFLHALAVTNFLNHAEEEFSTALTALNVLLSMSEKEPGDRKKLNEYRNSLEALDILDERESHALYEKAKCRDGEHDDKEEECSRAYGRLGVVKKCIRLLLEKLEHHAPGSSVIRTFCRYLRASELREIITSIVEGTSDLQQEDVRPSEFVEKMDGVDLDDHPDNSISSKHFQSLPTSTESEIPIDLTADAEPHGENTLPNHTADEEIDHDRALEIEDSALDFLEPSTSPFNDNDDSTVVEVEDDSLVTALDSQDHEPYSVSNREVVMDTLSYPATMNDAQDIHFDEPLSVLESDHELTPKDDTTEAVSTVEDEDPFAISDDPFTTSENPFDVQTELDADLTTHTSWLDSSLPDEAAAMEADATPSSMFDTGDELGHTNDESFDFNQEVQYETQPPYDESVTEAQDVGEEYGDDGEEEAEDTFPADQVNTTEEAFAAEDEPTVGEQPVEEGAEDEDDEEAEMFGDWEKGFDPNSNHYFWFNHSTGESVWTPPEGWPYAVDNPFEADGEYSVQEEEQGEWDETRDAQNIEHTYEEGEADWIEHHQERGEEHGEEVEEFEDDDAMFDDQDLPVF